MLESLFVGLLILAALPLAIVLLALLPFVLLVVLVKLLVALLLLPFRVLGALLALGFGLLGLLVKGVALLLAGLVVVGLFAGGTLLFVLVPLGLIALCVWVALRLLAPGVVAAA